MYLTLGAERLMKPYAMEAYRVVKIQLHVFLAMAVN
jgi:hypothetical protein